MTRCVHFIAINRHGFHDAALLAPTLRSALVAAGRLRRARPAEPVHVTLFCRSGAADGPTDALPPGMAGLRFVRLAASSNGAALNAQVQAARAAGARVLYRVDADDPVAPDRFVWQAGLMAATGAAVTGGALKYVNTATGARMTVVPPRAPGPRDYIQNCAMLHPALAFDVSALHRAGVRYWQGRLEDKHLGLSLARAGLPVVNDDRVYGTYTLNPAARQSLRTACTNLRLNRAYLRHTRRPDLLPLALALFAASALLPSQWLRRVRALLHGWPVGPAIRPCSGSADESDRERTAQ